MVGCGSRFVRDPVRQAGLGATRLCERTDQSSREPRNELSRARVPLSCVFPLFPFRSGILRLSFARSLRSVSFRLRLSRGRHALTSSFVSVLVAPAYLAISSRTRSHLFLRSSSIRFTCLTRSAPVPVPSTSVRPSTASHLPLSRSRSRTHRRLHARPLARARDAYTTRLAAAADDDVAEERRARPSPVETAARVPRRAHRTRPRISPAGRNGRALNRRLAA